MTTAIMILAQYDDHSIGDNLNGFDQYAPFEIQGPVITVEPGHTVDVQTYRVLLDQQYEREGAQMSLWDRVVRVALQLVTRG